ncbi:hypothetical protein [Geitlerinema calcuttense]|uniref:Lysozyme n=1 Tax=Geitlerinema calcuttense NRMC-F 0142 TaxID=2922238 RepID=A0ABT7M2M4_9CYAN|nr:hypothetical protein [Geitlerinema calcuttense]MDL5057885.1 hypothetical protein [Geitlerinema calcuttense NRMC-F 0142]
MIKTLFCAALCLSMASAPTVQASSGSKLSLSREQYSSIGQRIWKNECAGTVEGLTAWNKGEEFMSLGIGHFIWYPKGKDYGFDESFPKFVQFAASRGYKLPGVLLGKNPACPWNSRQEFQAAFNSAEMKSLRAFLKDTVTLQAEFIARRLEASLPKILAAAPASQRADIEKNSTKSRRPPAACMPSWIM